MNKMKFENIIICTIYASLLIFLIFYTPCISLDEFSNLRFGLAPHFGEKWYSECNTLVLPISAALTYLVTFVTHNMYMMRILNAIVNFFIFFFSKKIAGDLRGESKTFLLFLICSAVVIYEAFTGNYYYDYNEVSFLFILISSYFIVNKTFSIKNAVFISIFCSLIILTKHTTGVVFCVFAAIVLYVLHKKEKDFSKKLVIILLNGCFIGLCTIAYLLFSGTFFAFLDLGTNSSFSNNKICESTWVYLTAIESLIATVLIATRKTNIKKCICLGILIIPIYFVAFPIADFRHLSFALIFVGILICTNLPTIGLIAENKMFKIITCLLKYLSVLLLFITILLMRFYVDNSFSRHTNIGNISGIPISTQAYSNLSAFYNFSLDKEVIVVGKNAIMFDASFDNYHGYMDFLWDGNTGHIKPLQYAKQIEGYFKTSKDKYILLSCNFDGGLFTSENEIKQWDTNIDNYIDNTYEFIGMLKNANFRIYKVK